MTKNIVILMYMNLCRPYSCCRVSKCSAAHILHNAVDVSLFADMV